MMMEKLTLKVGKAITPTKELEEVAIVIEEGKIKKIAPWDSVDDDALNYPEAIACPGFVNIHMHGCAGCDATSGDPEDLLEIAESITENGVTTILPTTMSDSQDNLVEAAEAFKEAKRRKDEGADMAGIHFEGPYFGTGEEKGAQNPEVLRKPDVGELEDLYEAANGMVERITLAPELEGAEKYIERAKEMGITLSAGHTAASYDEAIKGFDAGIDLANHLYNGMKGFHHRNPGIIGATLTRNDVYAEMITDLIHLHPAAIDMAIRAKGVERSILITDAISATGLPDGEYELGGQEIVVEGGTSRIKETGRLAGSTLTMDDAIKNVYSELDYGLTDVVRMATLNPATVIGYSNKGRLNPGCSGDIAVLDSELNVLATVVEGEILYEK